MCALCWSRFYAATPLVAPPVAITTPPGTPVTSNALVDVIAPATTTTSITGFKVPGSSTLILPGPSPVPVVDPATGVVTGTIEIQADGTYTFTPAPGFTGPVPPIMLSVSCSDGQAKEVPLSINVSPLLRVGDTAVTAINNGSPVTTNVLNNTAVPPGKTAVVASFSIPGGVTYPAGAAPVTVTDPLTGVVTGTVTVAADGTAVFRPAAAYTGPVPTITYTVRSSDGQVAPGTLSVTLLSSKCTC